MDPYFSEHFKVDPDLLEKHGAFDIRSVTRSRLSWRAARRRFVSARKSTDSR